MLKCEVYVDLREQMWREFERITETKTESLPTEDSQLNALIGEQFQPEPEEEKDSPRSKAYKELMKVVMK